MAVLRSAKTRPDCQRIGFSFNCDANHAFSMAN
jgi:hypothetical protein